MGIARAEDVDALAARIAQELVSVRNDIDSSPRLPIILSEAQYADLNPPIPGQVYIIL